MVILPKMSNLAIEAPDTSMGLQLLTPHRVRIPCYNQSPGTAAAAVPLIEVSLSSKGDHWLSEFPLASVKQGRCSSSAPTSQQGFAMALNGHQNTQRQIRVAIRRVRLM